MFKLMDKKIFSILRSLIQASPEALYPLLDTVSTQETSKHDKKTVNWDIKNQLKQTKNSYSV